MNKKLHDFFRKVKTYVPELLPQNPNEFDKFAKEILYVANLPDNDSFRHALASQIMHLGDRTTRAPKNYFIKLLFKAIANQTAFQIMQELKERAKNEKTVEAADSAVV